MANTFNNNTITLSGIGGTGASGIYAQSLSSITLDEAYTNVFKAPLQSEYVKRYEVIETTEDVLALSVAWKRLRDNRESTPVYINSLLTVGLFQQVTNEDREHANTIRDYFSKKIMMWTLKEVRLSSYRQDLSEFIHGDGKKITEKMLPLAFRLPEFYEYDIEFDQFKQNINININDFKNHKIQQKTVLLKPVKSFFKSNKRTKQFEYWLKDSNDNAYMIPIEPKNPLKHIWDSLFMNQQLHISGTIGTSQADDLQYYKVNNWKLVSEI